MFITKIILHITVIVISCDSILTVKVKQTSLECEKRIFEECTHQSQFSDEEVDRARLYIQEKMYQADLPPTDTPPCAKLRVRKDFKCMSEAERQRLVSAVRQLYANDDMLELGDIHVRYWKVTHTTTQTIGFHRYLVHEIEKRLQRIDPEIDFPYWNYVSDYSAPEKSVIFKYFGTNGTFGNGYCVEDGPVFEGLNLKRCIRRQRLDNKIPPWESPEMISSYLQFGKDYLYNFALFFAWHFLPHLALGGYYGDMSTEFAAHDILFYLHHHFATDVIAPKLQMNYQNLRTPLEYNDYSFVNEQGFFQPGMGDLAHDRIPYFTNYTQLDLYYTGFGDMCSVTDQLVEDINRVLNGTVEPIPLGIAGLPGSVLQTYYPNYASGNYTPFDSVWPDVGQGCNPECHPMPRFQSYYSNGNGMRLMRKLIEDTQQYPLNVPLVTQQFFFQLYDDLQANGYCSPYIL